jgi:type IV pilus biogenesis protein CpaD/CtpE
MNIMMMNRQDARVARMNPGRVKPMIALAVLTAALLAGCYESPKVVLHKPGVYKGPTDPLVAKEATPEQQQKLLARFNQIQTDR